MSERQASPPPRPISPESEELALSLVQRIIYDYISVNPMMIREKLKRKYKFCDSDEPATYIYRQILQDYNDAVNYAIENIIDIIIKITK